MPTHIIAVNSATADPTTGDVQIPVFKSIKTFTDAQIKAIPTTPLDIVDAQGANKIIIPISCVGILKVPGGVSDFYTNNTDAVWYLKLNRQASNIAVVQQALGGGSVTSTIINFSLPVLSYIVGGSFDATVASNWDATEDQGDLNKPLKLYGDYLGGSDYTGGNAANELKVTTCYMVIDLS
jgi:hypothetical protein